MKMAKQLIPSLLVCALAGACSQSGDASKGPNSGSGATPPPSGASAATETDAPALAAATPAPAPTPAVEPAPAPEPEPAKPAWQPREEDKITPHQPLEFIETMAPFFDRLAVIDDALADGGKPDKPIVRVVHLGASMIGNDDLPGILREKFQTRFGDGGAGLVLLQRYMPNYIHRWVKLNASGWDHCYIAYLCKKDGHYGLGGTTFWSTGGARTVIETRKHELGDEVSRFEFWYAEQPRGGKVSLRVDKEEPVVLETKADELADRYHEIDVEQGPHKIEVKAKGGGKTRAYGVVLETDGPGLVWDQFSMLGSFTKRLLGLDPDHIAGQIKHRDPDLIAFTYGGNDLRRVANKKLTGEEYKDEYVQVIERVRAGKPEAACLIIGITDRGKSLTFTILPEHVETIVEAQRAAAKQTGCAFFDTYKAMGGAGSLKKWLRKKPPLAAGDLKHLNHRGRIVFGGWVYDAIIAGYVAHRSSP